MLKKELADKMAELDVAAGKSHDMPVAAMSRSYMRNYTKAQLQHAVARREEKAAAEAERIRAKEEAWTARQAKVAAGLGGSLQVPVVRYPGETDQDLVTHALDFYGSDQWLVQGTVIPGMSENGHPVVCFTGDPEELAKLKAAYEAEGIQLDNDSPIYDGNGNVLN